jgi:predicted dehydrogenase
LANDVAGEFNAFEGHRSPDRIGDGERFGNLPEFTTLKGHHRNASLLEDLMNAPLRWGIIGTGLIAERFAADMPFSDSGVITAVGSRTQSSADRFGETHNVAHRHDSYESLVQDDDVDAVYVATPHPWHHDNALLALNAGKHVLVEKPFTMTAAEAQDLVDVSRDKGLFLMEAMWTRFLPHIIAVREKIAEGALGDIVIVMADHGQWFVKDPAFRLFAPELGGGALLDLGVYVVSFASMILGTPSRVTAMLDATFTGVDGQASMIFGYESGAQALLTCTSMARSETRASIVGTDARIEIEGDFYAPGAFTLTPRGAASERFEFAHEGRGLRHQAEEVARCVAAGEIESAIMPLDETVAIMDTMEQVLRFL